MDQKPIRTVSSAGDISKLRDGVGSGTSTPPFIKDFRSHQEKLLKEQEENKAKEENEAKGDAKKKEELKRQKDLKRYQVMIEASKQGGEGSKQGVEDLQPEGKTSAEVKDPTLMEGALKDGGDGSKKPVEMGDDDKLVKPKKDTTKVEKIEDTLPSLVEKGVNIDFFVWRYKCYEEEYEADMSPSRRRKATTVETFRRETHHKGFEPQITDGHKPPAGTSVGSTQDRSRIEKADVPGLEKRLKAGEQAILDKQKEKQDERLKTKKERQDELKGIELKIHEKKIISSLENFCGKVSILDFFNFLRQDKNREIKALYIRHATYCFETGVVLAKGEEEKIRVREAIEEIVDHGEADALQGIWKLVKLQNRRNNLKDARYFPHVMKLWYGLTLLDRVAARTLKKELTDETGLDDLRRNRLEDKYTHKELEEKHNRHAREYRRIGEKLHGGYEYARKEDKVDYARRKVREDIVEVMTYLSEREGQSDYARRIEEGRQAEKEFESQLGKDHHELDSKVSGHDRAHVIHEIKKHGTHPTESRTLAYLTFFAALVGVGAFAYAVSTDERVKGVGEGVKEIQAYLTNTGEQVELRRSF